MLSIDNQNNITLTRGDTLPLTVSLKQGSETYTPQEGDVIRIACSVGYVGEPCYKLKFSETIPNNTLSVTIPAETTGALANGTYHYDVEITHSDGTIDTVISADLTITGEVK